MNGPLLISLFVVAAAMVAGLLWFAKAVKWYNIVIFIVLFALWTAMYMFKVGAKEDANVSPWVWPAIACLYQLFQVLFRIPLGILSQKLKSRKQVVMVAGLANLLGMTIVVATNFHLASIVIATACTGIYGATFGLDSQYWSENSNIKKVFLSSATIFTIPVLASLLSNIIKEYSVGNNKDVRMIIVLVAIGIAAATIVAYSFMKERLETIGLDNMDPNAKMWHHKTYKDIFALSVAGAGAAFAYSFMKDVSNATNLLGYWGPLIDVISLAASVLTALFVIKRFKWIPIRNVTLALMVISTSVIGFAGVGGELSTALLVPFVSLGSIAFGVYIMALFGSALHFDHKFPALVLGIWLTIRSFAYTLSILIGGEVKAAITNSSHGQMWIGVSIMIAVLVGIVVTVVASRYLFKLKDGKKQSINRLIDHSVAFEDATKKLVEK